MRVKILKRSFAGAEFAPDVRVLKVGGHLGMVGEQLLYQRGAGGGQLSGAAEEGRALSSAGASIL